VIGPKNIALVVPTIRQESLSRFIAEWQPTGLFDKVDLIVMEDNPTRSFDLGDLLNYGYNVHHLCWDDIDGSGLDWSWIIPRRSDTVRSFAYWWAWRNSYEYIMTLDDDCYPSKDYPDLVGGHLAMLSKRTRWLSTLNNVRPRGVPYKNLGQRDVYVNHGIWQGILDYDAPQQLVNPVPEVYSHDNRLVPSGQYFPMCGMNVMWRREATVLMYHLLMGRWKPTLVMDGSEDKNGLCPLPFDRFGDIWCGILMKKVADHLGWAVSTGTPYIHHDRASNPFTNLRKEANGIEVNEWFWEKVDAISLPDQRDRVAGGRPGNGRDEHAAAYCYGVIGKHVKNFGGEHFDYWQRLGDAMVRWSDLFKVS